VGQASQKAFLDRLLTKLEGFDNDYQRAKVADRKYHTFNMKKSDIEQGVRDRLIKHGVPRDIVEDIILALDTHIRQAIKDTIRVIKSKQKNAKTIKLVKITLKSSESSDEEIRAVFNPIPQQGKSSTEGTKVYNQVFNSYKLSLETVATKVGDISEKISDRVDYKSRKYFNLAHEINAGIIESFVRTAMEESLEGIDDMPIGEIIEFINAQELTFKIIRDTTSNSMTVSVASRLENAEDGTVSRDKLRDLQKMIDKWQQEISAAIKAGDPNFSIAELPGSDSFIVITRKRVLKEIEKELKKNKNIISIQLEDTSIKHRKTAVTKKEKGKPAKKAKKPNTKLAAAARFRKSKKGTDSPIRLMALINAKLPQTVAKNMGPPRLENRTGRFASSVRVTEITSTAQGFPSIGFSYQRDPYGVFERTSGSRFANADRDPRDLIDLSIREIAQKMAIGRFYTRRV